MKAKPDTFKKLIEDLGGVSAFAGKMRLGEFAAKKMRDRNSVAVDHWPALIEVAEGEGITLEYSDLVTMRRNSQVSA